MSLAEDSSIELLARWRDRSDQDAATELYDRYSRRLIALAQSRLPARMNRRVDPEDIVDSACRSFFLRVRDGRIEVCPDDNLWNLLATITMRKLFGQVNRHTAARRDVTRETEPDLEGSVCLNLGEGMARDPGVDEVMALHEELNKALGDLKPQHRQMVEWRLLELSTVEIAEKIGCSDRLVRLVTAEFGKRLRKQLGYDESP